VFESSKGGKAARSASSLRTWRWRVRRSPCPSCPTTNPPYVPRPSAVDHLARDMLQRLTCSRTATSCVRCPMCTSGALRTERGWVMAVEGRTVPAHGMLQGSSRRHTPHSNAHGGASGANTRAAPMQLETTRASAWRMEAANGANTTAAPRGLKATRSIVSHTAGAAGARRWAASPLLDPARSIACRMAGGRRQHEGCSKPVARAPGSVYCRLCLQREQPDDA
jgi:hypothetical protein